MLFRVGVNLGDVIVDGDDIHGDGVNVAARLEAMADAGGICLSRTVREQIVDRLDLTLEDLGEVVVKNIARPVHAWNWREGPPASAAPNAQVLARPALAVLPFDNLSADPEQDYFADGITEDVITALSQWRWFPVIS